MGAGSRARLSNVNPVRDERNWKRTSQRAARWVAALLVVAVAPSIADPLVHSSFEGDQYREDGRVYIDPNTAPESHRNGATWWRGNGNWPQITSAPDPVCTGEQAVRIRLNKWDKVSYRTEWRLVTVPQGQKGLYFNFGEEYWLGWMLYIPEDWESDPSPKTSHLIMQFHGTPDKQLGETWRNPPVNLSVSKDDWFIRVRADPRQVTPDRRSYPLKARYDLPPLVRGRWHHVVLNFVLDPTNGWMNAYLDGKQVMEHEGGLGYNDQKGHYFLLGNYTPRWRMRGKDPKKKKNYLQSVPIDELVYFYDDFTLWSGDDELTIDDVSMACDPE